MDNLFLKLYVTIILQLIAFIFGRDEEEDQQACHVQDRQLTFFVMYVSPLTSEVYLFLFEQPVHNVIRHFSC